MFCPIFRHFFFKQFTFIKKKFKDHDSAQFDKLLNKYNNTNSFLYSSLNMEIVCSILKGINTVLREINEDSQSTNYITKEDYKK